MLAFIMRFVHTQTHFNETCSHGNIIAYLKTTVFIFSLVAFALHSSACKEVTKSYTHNPQRYVCEKNQLNKIHGAAFVSLTVLDMCAHSSKRGAQINISSSKRFRPMNTNSPSPCDGEQCVGVWNLNSSESIGLSSMSFEFRDFRRCLFALNCCSL